MESLARSRRLTTCPKCGYQRTAADTNPDWQCPRCQIAYDKFAAGTPRIKRMAAEARTDRSVYALLAANVLAIVIALAGKMSLPEMMLVYWIQSVIIGVSFFIRILSLQHFSTEGVTMNDEALQPTARSKVRVAGFFALHYGFFHFIYLLFIAFPVPAGASGGYSTLGYWLCAAVFLATHGYSLLENIAKDREGEPNLGTLMTLPYARIIPMHITIVCGGFIATSTAALLGFCALKTVADVVMHTAEHHVLRTSRPAAGSQDSVSSTTS